MPLPLPLLRPPRQRCPQVAHGLGGLNYACPPVLHKFPATDTAACAWLGWSVCKRHGKPWGVGGPCHLAIINHQSLSLPPSPPPLACCSVVADSLSAIKHAKVFPVYNNAGVMVDFR